MTEGGKLKPKYRDAWARYDGQQSFQRVCNVPFKPSPTCLIFDQTMDSAEEDSQLGKRVCVEVLDSALILGLSTDDRCSERVVTDLSRTRWL